MLAASCGNSNPAEVPPGYNPDAVSVTSIAPDRGLADPHTLIVDGRLYAMCGHDRDWDIVHLCAMDRWELWSTDDLRNWRYELSIDSSDTYIGDQDNCWAGDLATKDGKYYWYFSNLYHNTGVMVAPSITGPWRDALGEPLLPTGIIGKGKPYDPEIYEEDGVYSIIFSSGQYYIATLGDDMISLKDKPEKIMVYNEDGSRKPTGDKPCIFKRNDWYYLMWGENYAMAKELRGPYTYKGHFVNGGHGTVLQWKGQWYSLQEQHETNAFYRGVQLRPMYFNEDDTVWLPAHNWEYPLPGREYDFSHSRQGWRCEGGGTDVEWVEIKDDREYVSSEGYPESYISGKLSQKGVIIASTPFIHTPIYLCDKITIELDNLSGAEELKVAMYGYDDMTRFTKEQPAVVDWSTQEWVSVPLKGGAQSITISLDEFKTRKQYLHQLAIQPAADKATGRWAINDIRVVERTGAGDGINNLAL